MWPDIVYGNPADWLNHAGYVAGYRLGLVTKNAVYD
jgi:hypothetical protein